MTPLSPRDNLRGGAWLIADMSLNIWALSIVKALGLGYPAFQIVFIRAAVGLALISPLIWRQRLAFRSLTDLHLHLLRVVLSVVTLSTSFFAISRVPLALFTTINFIRPLVTMVLAALILREVIGRRRWAAAGVALVGVVIAMGPGAANTAGWSWGASALGLAVVAGSGAIIVTRRLRNVPNTVMMTFYTAGLAAFAAPFAFASWVPIQTAHLIPLLLVGLFAQSAQFCFLRAHFHGEAGLLSVLGYLSLILSVAVGYAVFGEIPTVRFWLGASFVVSAALWVTLTSPRVLTRPFAGR